MYNAPKLPKNPNTDLSDWDGHSKRGQAAYDRHFEFEKELDDAMDIRGQYDNEYEEYCNEYDNGPTGHGDICYSDADPGL